MNRLIATLALLLISLGAQAQTVSITSFVVPPPQNNTIRDWAHPAWDVSATGFAPGQIWASLTILCRHDGIFGHSEATVYSATSMMSMVHYKGTADYQTSPSIWYDTCTFACRIEIKQYIAGTVIVLASEERTVVW